MVTCNRLAAKCEDRLRFTFELGITQSCRRVAALASSEHVRPQAPSFRGGSKSRPRNDSTGHAPRPLVRRDFHARLAAQMGMESPDNRPAVGDRDGLMTPA
ncbi:hypothetical protein NK6_6558 [Bradyrhizobium diazoefficiens]|uniref:Uncharacterized protein n=1 Tax=Bradyrhizobium diazoefficiens TaxID=1355477 RepID=A0A0E3VVT3_9BRAD|nr:hypothetical protein NK6_6558 [Bradyrhizobium diazoefficiens]